MFFEGFESAPGASALVVILHGFRFTRDNVAGLIAASRDFLVDPIDVYAPTLPYSDWRDPTGANEIIARLCADLDEIWSRPHNYRKVILIGHSLGGVLLRRLLLAGSPRPPDYAGEFAYRDDLPENVSRAPGAHGWAAQVERLVLLATWDKGWSISDRVGWKYWLGLNLLGLIGHLSPDRKPVARTMFDIRKGAPFIVQTRLLWMAYRRWHNPPGLGTLNRQQGFPPQGANPLVIQVVGTKDDFVSPRDQVDNDVNGALSPRDPQARYFLLEMRDTDHEGAVSLSGDEAGRARRDVFRIALTGVPAGSAAEGGAPALADHALSPALFEDRPPEPDYGVEHVAFIIHGIRDDGYWTHRIGKSIKEEAEKIGAPQIRSLRTLTPTYGYFAMLSFVLPWIRRQKVEWFMDYYVNAKACYPNAIFHYVGHSNGTYLAARALKDYDAAHFGKIYFAGSVVRTDFDWPTFIARGQVERVHNARGATDWVVALLPKSIDYCSDLGGAGFDGFGPPNPAGDTPAITQSTGYANNQHSGAILEGHWKEIAKFIVAGAKPFATDEATATFAGKPLFSPTQNQAIAIASRLRPGLPLIVIMAVMATLQLIACLFSCTQDWWAPSTFFTGGPGFYYLVAFMLFSLSQAFSKWSLPAGWNQPRSLIVYVGGMALAAYLLIGLLSSLACGGLASAFLLMGFLAGLRLIATRF